MKHHDIFQKIFTAFLFLVFSGFHYNALAQEDGWEQMESINTARIYAGSCVIDNKIFVFGGCTLPAPGATASVEVYDTETDEWTVLKNMDQAKAVVCEVIDDKIYLMGGWALIDNSWKTISTNLEYDYKTDNYVEKQSTPINMAFGVSCVYNDAIYTFGGSTDNEIIEKSWIYDPTSDTWDSISDIQNKTYGPTVDVINNKMYATGGCEGSYTSMKISGKVAMYDPDTDSWEEKTELPYPVADHISVVHKDKILVFGGDTGVWEIAKSFGTNLIQEYDPVKNNWAIKQCMPFKRSGMAGEKVGNYVYIISGAENSRNTDEPFLTEVWRFNLDSLKDYVPPLGIEENKIACNFTLHPNYPNPFREYTQIKYDLQQVGVVRLQVFNFLGQEVTTLVNKRQSPGSYEVTWNAEDIKPGIYFVKLRVGDISETRKLLVY